MGLSSHLHDVSGAAPLPLLILASLASTLASVFSGSGAGAEPNPSSGTASLLSSSFSALVALAESVAASSVSSVSAGRAAGDCAVCLSAMAVGDRVRTLACRHAFHAACLDSWFDQSRLSCPLCRAGPAARDDVGRLAGEDAASWFSRF